jgi:hypothetical protein
MTYKNHKIKKHHNSTLGIHYTVTYGGAFIRGFNWTKDALKCINDRHNKLMATDWNYIQEAIKTGLESPIPYKVIPYKNGIGIKKIEFFKPIKNGSL